MGPLREFVYLYARQGIATRWFHKISARQKCTNAEFIRHFSFVLTINLCVMLTVKGLCSEVGYGLRALGASLRIADRGGVLKGKGTVTAHFILQRELPTFHPP